MSNRIWIAVSAIALPLALLGCSGGRYVEGNEYNDPRFKYDYVGRIGGESTPLFNIGGKGKTDDQGGGGVGVNAYLWRGALDTLSFMPLQSADPFGGVIITDWYTPPAGNNERFKATAFILGRQLRADGVKLSVFRQVLQGSQWVDAPVAQATVTEIENKMLSRARELRAGTAGG